jgi:hypothetical protein
MDARGIDDAALMTGARRSTMDELAAATERRTRSWCFEAASRFDSERQETKLGLGRKYG